MTANDELLIFLLRVLHVTGFDRCDDLFWRTDGVYAPVALWINCNDLFYWATADLERVTPKNIDILEQSYQDCRVAGDKTAIHGSDLFCCRVRQMRPQGSAYPADRNLWPLFDACGPERARDLNNPYRPGREDQL